MNKKQKLELLEIWQRKYESLEKEYEKIRRVFPAFTSEDGFAKEAYLIFDEYTILVEKMLGSEGDWLSWYCYENCMGKNGFKAGKDKKMKNIKSLEDLLWIIEL